FKLDAHFLDLRGLLLEVGCESLCLLFELGCESLYLFLLLGDLLLLLRRRCLQLLNFVIEHGLVRGLGAAARLRSVTMRCSGCGTSPAHGHVNTKLIGIKIKSNCNHAAPNWLGIVPDTTDVAGCGPEPINREVGDTDRKVFVIYSGTIGVHNAIALGS